VVIVTVLTLGDASVVYVPLRVDPIYQPTTFQIANAFLILVGVQFLSTWILAVVWSLLHSRFGNQQTYRIERMVALALAVLLVSLLIIGALIDITGLLAVLLYSSASNQYSMPVVMLHILGSLLLNSCIFAALFACCCYPCLAVFTASSFSSLQKLNPARHLTKREYQPIPDHMDALDQTAL